MNLIEDLRTLLAGDVLSDNDTLEAFSRDTSLFRVRPQVVVAPRNTRDVQKLVRFVREHKSEDPDISLTARSGGSCMSGGSLNTSIVLDFTKYMNTLHEVGGGIDSPSNEGLAPNEVEGYAVVEPGMYYRDFEPHTLQKGLLMPSFPASREICAVGGMVANNAGGEKTLMYGKTEDFVNELDVVLSDGNTYTLKPLSAGELKEKKNQKNFEGEIYRKMEKLIKDNHDILQKAKPKVHKNSAGYYLWNVWDKEKDTFDLTKLFVGSQGTLGIITNIYFRLIRPHKHSTMLVMFLRDTKNLADIVGRVLAYNPATFESYDDHTLKLALKFFPQFVKLLGSNVFSLGFKFLPEVTMVLTGGFPKLVLTAEFVGESEESVRKQAEEAQKAVAGFDAKTHITKSEQEEDKYHTIRRESFNLLRNKIKGKQTAPFIDDIIVPPKKLPKFLPQLEALLNEYDNLVYTIAGHIGDGNFHIIPLMDLTDPASKKTIQELAPRVYKLVVEFGGSITAEHNDGIIRTPFLSTMYSDEVLKLFKQTKEIFDPDNIFNPGKKVPSNVLGQAGGDFNYALEHISAK